MCGRTACTLEPDDVVKACTYKDGNGKRRHPIWKDAPGGQTYWPSYNIAPTQHTPVLVASNFDGLIKGEFISERTMTPMKWGLTPSWHKGDPYKVPYETNNCRAEGMLEKKTYKVPLQKGRRCVVLADGYYEWKATPEGKQPYFFYFPQPNNITYPGETAKIEIIKDEKTNIKETHLDKAIKQELLSQEVGQETHNSNQRKSNTLIKQEGSSDVETHKLPQPVNKNNLKQEKPDSCDIETKPPHSFWDAVKSEKSEVQLDPITGESQLVKSCDVAESVHGAEKLKQADNGDGASDEVGEWKGQRLLTMAGVYDVWKSPDGSPPLYSYSVITVPASSELEWCHNRMPAILSTEEEVQKWLDAASVPLEEAASLVKPQNCLKFHPVSKAVNNSRYKSPDCIKPVELSKPKVCPSSSVMRNWLKSGSPAKKKKIE
ncbi:unnamed protein product [Candidula unifasciata]|uniref:Abasic site processing protein HMCES n=1 Tax=Candidula unifasciata TaxID=100452 RepID=A0A8S3YJX7_9EUPU|nr:unnamed protein product [Candidula unifasciata]